MKEEGKDHVKTGFKTPGEGWHFVEFGEGIDYLPGKGGEGVYVSDTGFKTYKFPAIVKDENDADNGADASQLCGMEKGGTWLANILACVGLWEAVCKRFPGKDVTVWDEPVINGIKAKLPGLSCMIRYEADKKGEMRIREMASHARYKEIKAEEKAADKKGEAGKAGKAPSTPASTVNAAEEEKW